ncbi:replication factor A [Halobacteriales archaeon QS_8_69_26]|nr:MAG: replication factor A [Halobacteriales archaeon QS_8_69_26]
MGDIEDVYEDLDTDVPLEEFRTAVEEKVEQMGGLADEETAAMLVAHELDDGEVEGVADVEAGMEDVGFTAKVIDVDEVREFERDDGSEGRVLNAEVADETGTIRIAMWDKMAEQAADELEAGDTLRIAGRANEGYRGVEVNVDDVQPADEDLDVQVGDTHRVEDLALGMSGVNVRGTVLDAESVRTFDRDDGSEGRVANLTIGDPTGRVRVTLWDDRADRVEDVDPGDSVEVVDGYVRERDGDLEVHVNDRSSVAEIDEDIEYEPETTPIGDVEIGRTVDIAGVVRSADPKRTFDRDDGSEGQVRNVRVQDDSGDIRVALWGDKADLDVGPGDRVALGDVEIQDGWQDDLEASANWQSTVTVLGEHEPEVDAGGTDADAGLSAFADDGEDDGSTTDSGTTGGDPSTTTGGSAGGAGVVQEADPDEGESVEFTGTVVQAGDPVVLDDGERTVSVETTEDVRLGQEVTVRGEMRDGRVDADQIF